VQDDLVALVPQLFGQLRFPAWPPSSSATYYDQRSWFEY